MQDITLEYIAGFVDGEGTFTICKSGENCYTARFSLPNTDLKILEDIQKYFNIEMRMHKFGGKDPKRKTVYQLQTQSIQDAKYIAGTLMEHLRVKKEQAKIILEYPKGRAHMVGNRNIVNIPLKAKQKELRDRIVKLNKRGPGENTPNDIPLPDPQKSFLGQPR